LSLCLPHTFALVSSLAYFSTLKMEATFSVQVLLSSASKPRFRNFAVKTLIKVSVPVLNHVSCHEGVSGIGG
jgi:branched-subunit amino acid permease